MTIPHGFSLAWTRVAPGHYVCGKYEIHREATTHGMKRASNPMWFLRHSEILATFPSHREEAARTLAEASVSGYAVLIRTAYDAFEWQVRQTGPRIDPIGIRTLAMAQAQAERRERRLSEDGWARR